MGLMGSQVAMAEWTPEARKAAQQKRAEITSMRLKLAGGPHVRQATANPSFRPVTSNHLFHWPQTSQACRCLCPTGPVEVQSRIRQQAAEKEEWK